jgi:dsDNA-specific endonuclease/ATPase MutS2
MNKFHEVLRQNQNEKGKKIVFIHGIGNGTLKQRVHSELKSKYKKYYEQDASFKEYGWGATMVTIR